MARRPLNFLASLCFLLCLAAACVWVRSYFYYDRVERVTYSFEDDASKGFSAWSADGRFAVQSESRLHPPTAFVGTRRYAWPDPQTWRADQERAIAPTTEFDVAGFTFAAHRSKPRDRGPQVREWALVVPHWALVLVAGAWPGIRATRRLLAGKRYPPGHCGRCGYDLRATPGRCPECGTPREAVDTGSVRPAT